jgi:DNA-binding NarL/FixJ family response regulator
MWVGASQETRADCWHRQPYRVGLDGNACLRTCSGRGFTARAEPADVQALSPPDLVAGALETGASPLTHRETDVLRAATTGASTEDIARLLFLAPTTVRNYRSNAITKVGARNRSEAIRICRDAGWL